MFLPAHPPNQSTAVDDSPPGVELVEAPQGGNPSKIFSPLGENPPPQEVKKNVLPGEKGKSFSGVNNNSLQKIPPPKKIFFPW